MHLSLSLALGSATSEQPRLLQPDSVPGLALFVTTTTADTPTLASASVSSDTLSTWTRTGLGTNSDNGDGTITITDTVGLSAHSLTQAATGLLAGPAFLDVQLGYVNIRYAQIRLGSGVYAYVDVQNGTVVSTGGGASARLIDGQTWRVEGEYAVANMAIAMSADGLTNTYSGLGTGQMIVGTGAKGPRLVQDRLIQLTDASGAGNDGSQATDGSRMLWRRVTDSGFWVPLDDTSGALEFGWPADTVRSLSFPHGLYDLWTHASAAQPITTIEIVKRYATPTATADGFALTGATAIVKPRQRTTGNVIASNWHDDAAGSKSGNFTGTVAAAWQSIATVFDGSMQSIYVDGVLDATGAVDRAVGAQTFTAAALNSRGDARRALAVYAGALDLNTLRRVTNWLRVVDCGMSPI